MKIEGVEVNNSGIPAYGIFGVYFKVENRPGRIRCMMDFKNLMELVQCGLPELIFERTQDVRDLKIGLATDYKSYAPFVEQMVKEKRIIIG